MAHGDAFPADDERRQAAARELAAELRRREAPVHVPADDADYDPEPRIGPVTATVVPIIASLSGLAALVVWGLWTFRVVDGALTFSLGGAVWHAVVVSVGYAVWRFVVVSLFAIGSAVRSRR